MLSNLFTFLRPVPSEATALVEALAEEQGRSYPFALSNFQAGVKIQDAPPELQRQVALSFVEWFQTHGTRHTYHPALWKMRSALLELLKRPLPFTEADLRFLIEWSINQRVVFGSPPHLIKICATYLKHNPLSDALRTSLQKFSQVIGSDQRSAEAQRWVLRIKELIGDTELLFPLDAQDVWAAAALNELKALPMGAQTAWLEVLLSCLRVTGSAPSAKWLKAADVYLDRIGRADFFAALERWLPLVDEPRPEPLTPYDNRQTLLPVNADLLKGLVWLTAKSDSAEMARVLATLAVSAYRKIPQHGPRAVKVGNACFWALGNLPHREGVSQLSILKTKIKGNSAHKAIGQALEAAARRLDLTAEEIEELSVPNYGLATVGQAQFTFEDTVCQIQVDGLEVTTIWQRGEKKLTAPPKTLKERYAPELKAITQTVKNLRQMLPAQRDRIENVYLAQKRWKLAVWRERYCDHPLVGTIARRLIWKFSQGDQAASGIWWNGALVGRDDVSLTWLSDDTTVELWHPLQVEVDVVLQWRAWLMKHEVRQPFKQAHREVYLLTDAERHTHTYSNRYAAHILRQHQFNALCAARSWKNALRLMVDAEFPPATKTLSHYGLRVEYWVEGIGTNYETDTNTTGTYLYLTTDQVRFYHLGAIENRAHAGGGGYSAVRRNGVGQAEPIPLEEIPPLVFSEIFRDVDMFVGVTSVGNDPTWLDGGGEVRYQDYWHNFSFGELNESAKTRKQLLEVLLPRLKIASHCTLTDKFLIVRGQLRAYKIHLGSGNILMEPNDQYLCIVPSRSTDGLKEKLFVPFEGDQTLAVILSKAMLLAEDQKITDATIVRQIKR